MANKHENAFVEAMKAIKENNNALVEAAEKAIQEKVDQKNALTKKLYSTIESRDEKVRFHGKLLESAKDHALCDSLKAIYITALERYSGLTDDEYLLAESLVEGWVKENGGASAVFNRTPKDNYLLTRLSEIVEDAAHRAVTEVESISDADDDSKEDEPEETPEVKNTITIDGVKYIKADDQGEESNEEEAKEESESDNEEEDKDYSDEIDSSEDSEEDDESDEEDESEDDNEDEDTEDSSEDEDLDDEESDEEDVDDIELSDEEDKDLDDELLDDDPEEDEDDEDVDDSEDDECDSEDEESSDEDEDSDQLYQDLENEEDVQKAIDTIHTRVADAEEKFIQKNAEDKKKVDELLHKINDNIKTVEEIDDKDNPKSKVAEEAVRLAKREINDITEKGVKTVFESMANEISKSVYLNESVKEQYTNEDGRVDTDAVIGRTRVMYGFLETLNTLQLDKVNPDYIKNVIDNIN